MDNELILFDRLEVIKTYILKYGIDNCYLSFSGGKDSMVVSTLLDMALPNNSIPRVYANTGIEYQEQVRFVRSLNDIRIIELTPKTNIKQVLEKYGYPFKSKEHSYYVDMYQRLGYTKTTDRYLNPSEDRKSYGCPNKLKYQFNKDFDIRISDKCCYYLKELPLNEWQEKNNKSLVILGLMRSEGGRRNRTQCIRHYGKITKFSPLAVVSKEWEDWFIKEYNVPLSKLYTELNFKRTGCKGCPFAIDLQEQLKELDKYYPNERKQCEYVFKPVYEEYRKVGYRLKQERTEV